MSGPLQWSFRDDRRAEPGTYAHRPLENRFRLAAGRRAGMTNLGAPLEWDYYRHAVTTVDAEQLGGVMLERLAELFDEDRGADTRVKSRRAA